MQRSSDEHPVDSPVGHHDLTIEELVEVFGELAFAVEAREAVETATRVIMEDKQLDRDHASDQLARWASDQGRDVVDLARVIARTHLLPDVDPI